MVKGSKKRRLSNNMGSSIFYPSYVEKLKRNSEMLSYEEMLETKEWRDKRDEVLLENLYKCKVCGKEDKANHVHHPSYNSRKLPWEYPNSFFEVLCEHHHEEMHGR